MSISTRRRAIKHQAKKLLFSNMWSCFCLSAVVLVIFCGIASIIYKTDLFLYEFFGEKVYVSLMTLFKLLLFILIAPFVLSVIRCFYTLASDSDSRVSSVVYCYSSKELFLAYLKKMVLFSSIIFSLLLLPRIVSDLLGLILNSFPMLFHNRMASCVINILFLAFILFIFTLFCGFAFVLKCYDRSVISSVKESFRLMKGHKLEFLYFCLSFLPCFILSYLSFGILWLYSIPYFFISISCFLNYVVTENVAPVFCDFS